MKYDNIQPLDREVQRELIVDLEELAQFSRNNDLQTVWQGVHLCAVAQCGTVPLPGMRQMLKTKQCKHGIFTYYDNDRYIGRQLDVLGYYSENEVQTLLGLVTADSTVVDVGANIGAITVPLAKKAKTVYAFEPQPAIYDLLCANIMANKLTNVEASQEAIGGKMMAVEVPRYDMEAPDMNTGAVRVVPMVPWEDVPDDAVVVPMDTLDYEVGLPIDLIKIDVEGMELEVLKGARRTIKKHQPFLYLENNLAKGSPRLIEYIMNLGYELCWHLPVLECLTNATHRTLTLSSNMLCVPPSRPVAIGGPDFWPIEGPDDNWHRIPQYAQAIAAYGL